MDDEKLLEEYILNDTGAIYYGSSNAVRPRPWNFGQVRTPTTRRTFFTSLFSTLQFDYTLRNQKLQKLLIITTDHEISRRTFYRC
jgi:hypothetical protein